MKNKKRVIIGLLSIFIMYFSFFLLLKYSSIIYFTFDLLFIVTLVIIFVSFHIFYDINKLYEFLYKYRYIIGASLLIYITILGYNGSSIAFWNRIVQPNIKGYETIIGIARGIRSDEWMVTTPAVLSQQYNNFSDINNTIMGVNSNVTLFPSLPAFDISIICNVFNLPYLVLPFENAYAFVWYGKIFLMFFVWFELFMIITKKRKLYSLLGAVLITFSAANMWWSFISISVIGPLAILIVYKFINSNKFVSKIILSILLGIVGLNYIFVLYPAWQVSYGYVFLSFIIWLIYENKNKLNFRDLLYVIPTLILIVSMTYYVFNNSIDIYNIICSTAYPGERFSTGGYGYNYLFNYFSSIFFPIINYVNPSEMSNYLSFYPVPILLSIYYAVKNKKKDPFLIIFSTCAIFLSIWNYVELPSFISKITLMSFSIPERSNIAVGFICILLFIRIISLNFNNEKLEIRKIIFLTLISSIIMIITISIASKILINFLSLEMIIVVLLLFIPIMTMILLNNEKTNKYLSIILIIISLLIGGTVNPINKGVGVLTNKPFAKEVRKIAVKNSKDRWITVNSHFAISNYLVANGATTINSVNFYPNLKLWSKLDANKEYEDIYNRYAHITINLTDESTSFELVENDKFNINLNISDIILLDVKYIVSQEDLSRYQSELLKIKLLYNEDGIYIYEIES